MKDKPVAHWTWSGVLWEGETGRRVLGGVHFDGTKWSFSLPGGADLPAESQARAVSHLIGLSRANMGGRGDGVYEAD